MSCINNQHLHVYEMFELLLLSLSSLTSGNCEDPIAKRR